MGRIEEIRERWAKATPGPWRWSNTSSDAYLFGARTRVVMAFKRKGMNGAQPVFRREDNILYPAGKENINAFSDAYAIAAAPDDVAWLLAEVERRQMQIIDLALEHAKTIDSEWGCSHELAEIEQGHTRPDFDGDATIELTPENCMGRKTYLETLERLGLAPVARAAAPTEVADDHV